MRAARATIAARRLLCAPRQYTRPQPVQRAKSW